MKNVTNSATNVLLNCEKVQKALMEEDQDDQTQKETKIVEKKEKKEHEAYEERAVPS